MCTILKFVNLFMLIVSLNLNASKKPILKDGVNDYEAYLIIPEINVSRPIYATCDERSNIDKNIIFVEGSDTPLTKKGNVIIAGHSGSSTVSYFKKLHKLEPDDFIFLEYGKYRYKYVVDNVYLVKKTGNVEVRRDNNVESITLITCYGKDKQLVVIANKVSKIKK